MTFDVDIAAAIATSGRAVDFTPANLGLHIQAALQGAFVLAKATYGPEIAADGLRHLRRCLEMLFLYPQTEGEAWSCVVWMHLSRRSRLQTARLTARTPRRRAWC